MKKKKNHFKFILLLIFFFTLLIILIIFAHKQEKICFEKKCFIIEKVSTPETRAEGLMYRTSLDEDQGMLFVFENESIYPFWMKNTLIPLDMIWIDSSGKVVYVYENAVPCKETCIPIYPNSSAKYVLEINAGLLNKYSINPGSKAILP